MKHTILVIDDDAAICESLALMLKSSYQVICAEDGASGLKKVVSEAVDLILLDIIMPGMDGLETLKRIKEINPDLEVLIITASKTVENAVQAMKLGAYDYVTKPFQAEEIRVLIKKALEKKNLVRENLYYKQAVADLHKSRTIIGESHGIQKVRDLISKVAAGDSNVLITGESGTGKELIARAIHQQSPRAEKPFVAMNCGAIPVELVESELFGHEPGAFTTASQRRIGKFEFANEGTIFLDDVNNLPVVSQVKLLRMLQEKELTRLGSNRVIPIDVRVISSTNVELETAIANNTFRQDLYYRLRVVPIHVPPLRERRGDLPILTDYFLAQVNRRYHKHVKGFMPEVMKVLLGYSWPGNVRELINLIEMTVILAEGDFITINDLPPNIVSEKFDLHKLEDLSLKEALRQFESQFIKRVMDKTGGNQSEAAKIMGVHRNTIVSKVKKLR